MAYSHGRYARNDSTNSELPGHRGWPLLTMKKLPQVYFRHDATASSDGRLLKLRGKFGYEGMGVFWHIIETLYLNDGTMEADALRTLFDRNTSVCDYCLELGLLVEKEGRVYSRRLNDEIKNREEKSRKAKAAITKRWQTGAKNNTDTDVLPTNIRTKYERTTDVILGEERRGEYIKKPTKKALKNDDEIISEFFNLAISQGWTSHDYEEKSKVQLSELAPDEFATCLTKMRVAINASYSDSEHTRKLAKKIYFEVVGRINDFGAMQQGLNSKELASRRELPNDDEF